MRHKKILIPICIGLIAFALIFICNIIRIDRFGMSQISWVDCVMIDDTKYYSDFERSVIDPTSIGQQIGKVKFNVSKSVHNPSYRFRNGDATYLETGTEIYSIKSDSSAVAVKINTDYYIYKADTGE